MPSESKAQRRAMAIAEHDPASLYPENKGLADMSQSQLHDFASTKEKGLPEHVHKKHKHHKKEPSMGRKASPRGGNPY